MQNAWVLNQEILINPELYHPCLEEKPVEDNKSIDNYQPCEKLNLVKFSLLFRNCPSYLLERPGG